MDDDEVVADAFAERLALWHVLYRPDLMHGIDLAPMLVGPWQHQAIWKTMRWVSYDQPQLVDSPGPLTVDFVRAWAMRLCHTQCIPTWPGFGKHEFWSPGRCAAHHMFHMLEDAREAEWSAVTVNDQGLMVCTLPHHAPHNRRIHTFDYWVSRLTAVVEARAQITHAQRLAEEAWRWYDYFEDPKPEAKPDVMSIEALLS